MTGYNHYQLVIITIWKCRRAFYSHMHCKTKHLCRSATGDWTKITKPLVELSSQHSWHIVHYVHTINQNCFVWHINNIGIYLVTLDRCTFCSAKFCCESNNNEPNIFNLCWNSQDKLKLYIQRGQCHDDSHNNPHKTLHENH